MLGSECVDLAGGVTSAETVIDIHHSDATATGIQHAEQRGQSAEVRAVTDAGRHGDQWATHQSRDDTGQRAFHPGNHDDDIRLLDLIELSDESVQAGDAHIVNAFDVVAHDFSSDDRFLGDGYIARSGADDGYRSRTAVHRFFAHCNATGPIVMNCSGKAFGKFRRVNRRYARDEQLFFTIENSGGDFNDLLRCFAGTEDHFRETFAQRAVGIDLSEREFRYRRSLKSAQDRLHIGGTGSKFFQEIPPFLRRHGAIFAKESGLNNEIRRN